MTAPESLTSSPSQHDSRTHDTGRPSAPLAAAHVAAARAALVDDDATTCNHPSAEAIASGSGTRAQKDDEEKAAAAPPPPPAAEAPAPAEVAFAAAPAVSDARDAHASSEAVDSTLMGIALLAFLQSSAKHEADDGGTAAASAPSTSKGTTSTRVLSERTFSQTTAATAAAAPFSTSERVPRRYQRMCSDDDYALAQPLVWTLTSIKARESIPQYTCKRTLSSSTYLHRIHVNAAMYQNLLPDYGIDTRGERPISSRDSAEGARRRRISSSNGTSYTGPTSTLPTSFTRHNINTVVFRRRVRMLDEREREWVITYESLCSAGQRHTRFSAGWAALCRANEYKVGETIVFARWGERENGVVVIGRDE